LQLAQLAHNGHECVSHACTFKARRRSKTKDEVAGIRRTQRAAEESMAAARDLLRRASVDGRTLTVDGEALRSERIKRAIEHVFSEHDCSSDELVVAHGPPSAIGHHMGEGPILTGEPVVIDLWPRDRRTGRYADMTRTFVVGDPPDEIVEWHRLVLEALERCVAAIGPGVMDEEIDRIAAELFQEHGQPTMRTKRSGVPLEEGFYHGLCHGVGLEVHEAPTMSMIGKDELVVGDVTVEPGLYRRDIGGVRLEDLVLVTEDGHENLTSFPYDLTP
jgi:Xaa-Pro aminopeptidase